MARSERASTESALLHSATKELMESCAAGLLIGSAAAASRWPGLASMMDRHAAALRRLAQAEFGMLLDDDPGATALAEAVAARHVAEERLAVANKECAVLEEQRDHFMKEAKRASERARMAEERPRAPLSGERLVLLRLGDEHTSS